MMFFLWLTVFAPPRGGAKPAHFFRYRYQMTLGAFQSLFGGWIELSRKPVAAGPTMWNFIAPI
jgi:hypothetical protein